MYKLRTIQSFKSVSEVTYCAWPVTAFNFIRKCSTIILSTQFYNLNLQHDEPV